MSFKYTGDEKDTLDESFEVAARMMPISLVRQFKITVFDISLELRSNCEKCIQLFE